jgi:hypothetical protein
MFAMTALPALPSGTSNGGPRFLRASRPCARSRIADGPTCWCRQVQPSQCPTAIAPLTRSPHVRGAFLFVTEAASL